MKLPSKWVRFKDFIRINLWMFIVGLGSSAIATAIARYGLNITSAVILLPLSMLVVMISLVVLCC